MNRIIRLSAIVLAIVLLTGCEQENSHHVTIGIILPLEHRAMNEIVQGFKTTLTQHYQKPVTIKVANAQNDANLQRAIIQKMRDAHYTLIVPVGTAATQMTFSMARTQPIISLAANLSDDDRQHMQPCHGAVVHDEISSATALRFIHQVYPHIKRIALVHSSADKVFPEVKLAVQAGKQYGIQVTPVMASSLPELYSVAQGLPADTQAVFILKDSLIVSGISTLAKIAGARHIPLITSDQGSVEEGAGFSLGVHERKIGEEGALLAAAILRGKPICQLPVVEMRQLTVFLNRQAFKHAVQDIPSVLNAAKQSHYTIEFIHRSPEDRP